MQFDIDCECGKTHAVNKTAAGTNLACSCGRSVSIPSLAKLRRSAGLKGVEESPTNRVTSGVSAGILPPQECFVCGHAEGDQYELVAICESSTARTSGGFDWMVFLLTLFLSPLIVFSWKKETTRVIGRDTVVPVPISVCYSCKGTLPRPYLLTILRAIRWTLVLIGCVVLFREFVISPALVAVISGILLVFFIERFMEWRAQSKYRSLLYTVRDYRLLIDHFPMLSVTRS